MDFVHKSTKLFRELKIGDTFEYYDAERGPMILMKIKEVFKENGRAPDNAIFLTGEYTGYTKSFSEKANLIPKHCKLVED